MILIAERQKKKLGGVTSLFISFPYSKTIIDIIKASGTCAWDDSTHTWECPITSLAFLLDNLTYLDDIKLSVIDAEAPKIVWRPKLEYKLKPRDYQEEGILYGLNHNKWLLLDAPGLGKTLQLTCLAEELKAQKNVSHCLVICGIATLRANWEKEIAKGSNLASVTIGERINKHGNVEWNTVAKRAEQLMSPIKEFFIIINVESLRDKRIIDAIKKGPNKIDMMVLDEAHKCLGYDTLISTNIGKIKIGDIVENNIDCKVLTRNKNGDVEYQDIINRFKLDTNSIIELTVIDDDENEHILRCTPDHKIFTHNRGYVCAKDLNENDELEALN